MRGRKIAGRLCLLGLLGSIALAVWAFGIEPNRVVVRQVALNLPDWPADHQPLRLAMVSDIHAGSPFITAAKIDAVDAAIRA